MTLLLLVLSFIALVTNKLQINTTHGPVLGIQRTVIDERNGNNISWTQFSGIPYASPPIGDLRFRPPQPVEKWIKPRYVDDSELTICPQIILGSLLPRSNEDCLYLNVHVPSNGSDLFPVMVWTHGGGFMSGDGTPSSFGPQYFMDLEVLIVTINYRLGPLGYLSLGTEDIPGNMGQHDQVAALQWVQNNIESFGGDKDRVTLFGQSAGAFASTYHLYSPMSQGLFHRIIAQSGVAGFSPSFHHHQENDAIRYGNNAALLLGCIIPENRANCLREKSAYAIQNVEVPEELISQPSIDTSLENSYLSENPLDLIKKGDYYTDIDIMLGFNEDDGMLITQFFIPAPDIYGVLKELWDFLGPFALFQKHHTEITEEHKIIATEILNHYIDNIGIENLSPDNFWNMTDLFTDSFFTFANHLFLQHHLEHSNANTFQYRFSYNVSYHQNFTPYLFCVPGRIS